MSKEIEKIDKLLEKDDEGITPDDLDKELDGDRTAWQPKWFLIQDRDFVNYDMKNKVIKADLGKSWVKKEIGKDGKEVEKRITKNWTEIVVPFSKNRSECIRVKNDRIKETSSKHYFRIVLNEATKTIPLYTASGKKIGDEQMTRVIKKFDDHQKQLAEHIKKYKEQQNKDKEKTEKTNEKENEKSK